MLIQTDVVYLRCLQHIFTFRIYIYKFNSFSFLFLHMRTKTDFYSQGNWSNPAFNRCLHLHLYTYIYIRVHIYIYECLSLSFLACFLFFFYSLVCNILNQKVVTFSIKTSMRMPNCGTRERVEWILLREAVGAMDQMESTKQQIHTHSLIHIHRIESNVSNIFDRNDEPGIMFIIMINIQHRKTHRRE